MVQQGSRDLIPIILIRGFGGLDVAEEIADTHQGFNTGTIYPHKKGENYIYEGMVLRLLKSMWGYLDATNVVAFYPEGVTPTGTHDPEGAEYTNDTLELVAGGFLPWLENPTDAQAQIRAWQEKGYLAGSVVLDAKGALDLRQTPRPDRSLWVYRYYDVKSRRMKDYGRHLAKLIRIIGDVTGAEAVNIIAHSMGGLVVRALIQDPQDEFQ